MKLKKQDKTVQYVIEILEKEVEKYSEEFTPDRIVKVKQYIKSLQGA